jgi:hypothetical protein
MIGQYFQACLRPAKHTSSARSQAPHKIRRSKDGPTGQLGTFSYLIGVRRGRRLHMNQTKSAGGFPWRPRRLRRCANQNSSRGRNYASNRGGHATYNGCVLLDTSGTRPLVEAVHAAYSRCCHVYLTGACVLPLADFPEMATSITRGAFTSRKCNPKMHLHQDFQDRQLQCPKHIGATATIFVAAQPTGTSPERIMDGCCH